MTRTTIVIAVALTMFVPLLVTGSDTLSPASPTASPGVKTGAEPQPFPHTDEIVSLAIKAELLADSASELVGTAISPLVGVGAIGVLGYVRADSAARAALPWYNQPWWWGSVLGLLLLVLLKDTIGSAVPFVKKPLDALELVENKLSGLLAAPIVLQETLRRMAPVANELLTDASAWIVPTAYAAGDATTTAAGVSSALEGVVLALSGLCALVIYAAVWLSGHVVNVLVFLNPIPFIDWAMKIARLSVVGAVVGITSLHPAVGAVVMLIVILISLKLAGWSFRLTTLGSVFAWDLLRNASRDVDGENGRLLAFATGSVAGVKPRSLGRLVLHDDGNMAFVYRAFLVGPAQTVMLPPASGRREVGRGLLSPTLIESVSNDATDGDDRFEVLFRLPPRYRKQENVIATALGAAAVRDVSIVAGPTALWRWAKREMAGRPQAAA